MNTKIKDKDNYINSITIKIDKLPYDTLLHLALQNYNSYRIKRAINGEQFYIFKIITKSDDRNVLNKIMVDFIRHKLGNYLNQMKKLDAENKQTKEYLKFKIRFINEIKKIYPYLEKECDRQILTLKKKNKNALKEY